MPAPQLEQIGPYRVLEFVAEGGMAWVFKIRHPNLPLNLALKLLKPDAAVGNELQLFEREAQLLASIQHPNLVRIYDFGQDDATGSFFYTMEYIESTTLSQRVARDGAIPVREAAELMIGLLSGLQELHDRRVVHRDIKPGNIMAPRPKHGVLMDLGIARVLRDADSTQYTRTDVVRGTPLYMSPEQAEAKAVKPSSDIFSLGLSFYFVITGHTVYQDARNVDTGNTQSVRNYLGHLVYAGQDFKLKFPKRVPKPIREVIQKACRLDPEKRYPNADAMREELERALAHKGRDRRFPRAVVALVIAILALLQWGPDREAIEGASKSLWNRVSRPFRDEGPGPEVPGIVKEEWKKRSDQNREFAQKAGEEARAAKVDLPEYLALMTKGEEAFQDGEKAYGDADYSNASDSFLDAKSRFARAALVKDADAARQEARRLEDEAVKRGLKDFGRAPPILAKADGDFAAGRFGGAAEAYRDAIEELRERMGDVPENRAPELLARKPKEQTRSFRENESLILGVEAVDPDGDELRYAWKVDGVAQKEAGPELRLQPKSDSNVEVRVTDKRGNELADGPQTWRLLAPRGNRRPELRARNPKRDTVEVARNGSVTLSVEAVDPDRDELRYAWKVDGVAQKEAGPSFKLAPNSDANVEVQVTDEGGQELAEGRQRWRIAIGNTPPSLTVSPSGKIALEVGQTELFRATGSDADGDPLSFEWILDGQKVASSDVFPFEGRAEGSHQLIARATDTKGASSRQTVSVTVKGSASVAASGSGGPGGCIDSGDPRRPLLRALQLYETAWESCNVIEMEQIWAMSESKRRAFQAACEYYDRLVFSTKATSKFGVNGNEAWLCFQQSASGEREGSMNAFMRNRMMTGSLVCRPDGWQFTEIQSDCER